MPLDCGCHGTSFGLSILCLQDRARALPSLVLLCGDHGMSDHGGHGGSTPSETGTPLVFLSSRLHDDHGV